MSGLSNDVQGEASEVTESQALAICMQLADDFQFLMEKVGMRTKLTLETYRSPKFHLSEMLFASLDSNSDKLARSIVRNYRTYADFLRSRKYG